jgi:Integrase core domain
MDLGDHAEDFRFLVRDRAGQFTDSSGAALTSTGITAAKIPPRSPRADAHAERLVLTARTEITDRMLIFGERHLRSVLTEYPRHYNGRRPHRAASSGRPARPPRRRPLPGPDQKPTRPRRPYQRNMTEARRRPGQDPRPSSGTPHVPGHGGSATPRPVAGADPRPGATAPASPGGECRQAQRRAADIATLNLDASPSSRPERGADGAILTSFARLVSQQRTREPMP